MKNLVLFITIFFSVNLSAQDQPTLYLIGDSTMSDKKDPDRNPEHGWGQVLPELMTSKITIENHAVNGRSTRSFIAEGRWEEILNRLNPGDFVFIQFGHNDQKIEDPGRYTNPSTQYRANLEKFVNETREKGGKPVLFTSIVRRNFNESGVLVDTHGLYPLVTRMLANELKVPFVDLQMLTEQLEIAYGPEKSRQLHLHIKPGENDYVPEGMQDDTHLSRKGAILIASLALKELDRQEHELKKYIRPGVLKREKLNWEEVWDRSNTWFASEEAREIANNILLYQHNNGGWLKNINMARSLSEQEITQLQKDKADGIGTTIDNGATHTQLRFLARVYEATSEETYKEAFLKGVDFLLRAQYENGGWPQFYPIKKGYYEHITYNDGAMIGVMTLLRDIANSEATYSFVDQQRVRKAQKAIDKGLEVILKTQVEVDGELSIWCAQHDKRTFKPAKARAYELPSLSGKESTAIVEYLIELENPSEEVKKAIRSAVKWFEKHKVMGLKVKWVDDPTAPDGKDRITVEDPSGGPLWGRFNEIETGRPIFVGRDGIIKYNMNEIEKERRVNYNYIDNYAEDLLNRTYPQWEAKH